MVARKRTQKERVAERMRRARRERTRPQGMQLTKQRLRVLGIFTGLYACVVLVAFYGLSPAGPRLLEGQKARLRVTAEESFSYISSARTEAARADARRAVPPVYRLDKRPLESFEANLAAVETGVSEALAQRASIGDLTPNERAELIRLTVERTLRALPGQAPPWKADTWTVFFLRTNAQERAQLYAMGLDILRELYAQGIGEVPQTGDSTGQWDLVRLVGEEDPKPLRLQREAEARRVLRVRLLAAPATREITRLLYELLEPAVSDNLRFDANATEAARNRAAEAVQPVRLEVSAGEVLIEPGATVTAYDLERLSAYRRLTESRETPRWGLTDLFFEQAGLALLVFCGIALMIKAQADEISPHARRILSAGLLVFVTVGLIRLLLTTGTSASAAQYSGYAALVPNLLPYTLGPLATALLLGTTAGILAATVTCLITALMLGYALDWMLVAAVTSLVVIVMSRGVQKRGRIVRAGVLAGGVALAGVIFLGLRDGLGVELILTQAAVAFGVQLLCAVIVVGLLPFLEQLTGVTTDITLLELTDFNHPLLRRMQMTAPGSYHHSLMVANLSENAAAAIHANSLVCRVSALYHDIGKMAKPEYFTENQREGINPHLERNPSMSALIIKAHVKEGVALAREFRLPRVIRDVIREHHGTSLIQYFYYKAIEQSRSQTPTIFQQAPRIELSPVNEHTYRYEGPRPHFTESGIIMLADSLEAASRSLKKVTPQSVEDLVERLVDARVEDGQLDDTPITMAELARVKESFAFTLLNMLHARVEYPKDPSAMKEEEPAKQVG